MMRAFGARRELHLRHTLIFQPEEMSTPCL